MEYILISLAWVALGAAFNYWTYKTAYKEGLLDAVAQHNRGELCLLYTSDAADE